MPSPFILFFSPLLLLVAEPGKQPVSEIAECAANESEIENLQLMQALGLLAIFELKQKQEVGTISKEENAVLFAIELRLHQIGATISLRKYLRHECLNSELQSKPSPDSRIIT